MAKFKAIAYGLGPMGLSIAKLALERKNEVELVGAVDINPLFKGRDLSELLQLNRRTGISVTDTAEGLWNEADIVLHATSSFLSAAKSQLLEFCMHGLDVVSTTEELSYPWFGHDREAQELDECAKKNGVTLLGTGVNPGFVLDALAITLSGVCSRVFEIKGERILDALKRRVPFQKKVGIGLSAQEFEENVRTGKFGHIGLPESIAMVASAMGVKIEKIDQEITPKICERPIETENFGVVEKGKVIGLVQNGRGLAGGRTLISFHIEMYAGAEKPHDTIEIHGIPDINLTIPGGTPGDIATAAIIVNSIPRVIESMPGLKTIKDLAPAASVYSKREDQTVGILES